ncbi:MAG: hypothetical protein AABW50_04120 [Nanoarchaeota archaeon]
MNLEDKSGYLSFLKELSLFVIPGAMIYQARKDVKNFQKDKTVYYIAGGIEIIKTGACIYFLS